MRRQASRPRSRRASRRGSCPSLVAANGEPAEDGDPGRRRRSASLGPLTGPAAARGDRAREEGRRPVDRLAPPPARAHERPSRRRRAAPGASLAHDLLARKWKLPKRLPARDAARRELALARARPGGRADRRRPRRRASAGGARRRRRSSTRSPRAATTRRASASGRGGRLGRVTIAELQEDRVVEARLRRPHEAQAAHEVRRRRTSRSSSSTRPGAIEARVWNDVELLDGRFAEGDAVRVLAPRREVPRPAAARRALARGGGRRPADADAGDPPRQGRARRASSTSSSPRSRTPGCARPSRRCSRDRDLAAFPATPDDHHSYAGGLLEHTVGVATLCRETAQLHPRLRADLLLAAALVHDVGRTLELGRGPAFAPTDGGAPARPRAPRAAADRGARRGPDRGAARRAPPLRRRAPRRARRAHGRGGGALPREPARRGRRDAQGRLTPLLLALGASLAWGVARLRRPARQPHARRAAACCFWAQVGGVAAIAIAVAIRGEGPRRLGRALRDRRVVRRDARAVRVLPRHGDRAR